MQANPLLIQTSPAQWANWLDSVAQAPHSHHKIVQQGAEFRYLNSKQIEARGAEVQVASLKKIIEATQLILQTEVLDLETKTKMIKGLLYICEQKEARYHQLFFIFRWCAKLFGVEDRLNEDRISLLNLAKNTGVPLPHPPSANVEALFAESKDLWARKKLLKPGEDYKKQEISQEEKLLAERNPYLPSVKDIVKVFGEEAVKPTLKETLEFLLENHVSPDNQISPEDLARDRVLFQCSEIEAKAMYVKRMLKAKRTDLSLSLVTAIETTWKEMLDSNEQNSREKVFGQQRVIFIPGEKGGAFIKEDFLREGSYKAAFTASEYFSTKKTEHRHLFVALQPSDRVKEEIKYFMGLRQTPEEEESLGSSDSSDSEEGTEDSTTSCDTVIVNRMDPVSQSQAEKVDSLESDGTSSCMSMVVKKVSTDQHKPAEAEDREELGLDDPLQTLILPDSDSEGSGEIKPDSGSFSLQPGKDPHYPVKVTIKKSIVKQLAKSNQTASNQLEDEEDKDFKKEAALCVKLGTLPGIWPTHKVTTVDGQIVIIQEKAGYQVEGQDSPAIELKDLAFLAQENALSIKDQIIFLNMIEWFLKGVSSTHQQNLIHRDIKPNNILCSINERAGLSDFGLTCENASDNLEKRDIIGTPFYMAPEIVSYNNGVTKNEDWKKIDTKVDIWSTGLSLWEMLSGQEIEAHPSINNIRQPMRAIFAVGNLLMSAYMRQYEARYPQPKEKSLAHLVWQCTRADPVQRPSIEEVIKEYQQWKQAAIAKLQTGRAVSVMELFDSSYEAVPAV